MDEVFGEPHIQVSEELAELGAPPCAWGDALELAAGPDKKKIGEEARAGGLAWASCGMRGWRQTMEDASLMLPFGYIGGAWRDAALFGVFDGHGGEQVARLAVRKLPTLLAELPSEDPEAGFTGAFRRIDEFLQSPAAASELCEMTHPGNVLRDSAERCGTTAVCCMIRDAQMVLANAGDSRAVLCRKGKAVRLTQDHKPELPGETARIEAASGFIEEEALPWGGTGYRVNGDLNLSRALGDLHYKDPALPAHMQMVSGVPDTQTLSWRAGEDEFVVLACDGVWECMEDQKVVNFIRHRLPPPGPAVKKKLVPILEALLDACIANSPKQRGGLGCDNMTAVLVRFEDPAAVQDAEAAEDDEEKTSDGQYDRKLEAALSQTIQRLASGMKRRKETEEEKELRLTLEREEKAEAEAREREERERQVLRKRRREEREKIEKAQKKRIHCCAAVSDEEEDSDDFDE
mmetsp:Transcript_83459/g.153255  ORF Transcript_83459/g.153255 Transcript_83459/m.153255 type:complete len:462 (-) Transcript_83459:123-1508(-)